MSAGYRISETDMVASRLVFVMIKGSKPMRKVAIPIMEGMSWTAFESQVKAKLRIRGIRTMTLATTGEAIATLSQLQDIDQIHVEEDADIIQSMPSITNRPAASLDHRSNSLSPGLNGDTSAAYDSERKYTKRKGSFKSALQRWTPGFFSSGQLPVTTRDGEGGRRGRRRTTKTFTYNKHTVICAVFALLLVLVLAMFYLRGPRSGQHIEAQDPHIAGLHQPDPIAGVHSPPVLSKAPARKQDSVNRVASNAANIVDTKG